MGIDDELTIYDNEKIITMPDSKFNPVKDINVKAIRDQILQELGLEDDTIERIVLYGELMCTESDFDLDLKG